MEFEEGIFFKTIYNYKKTAIFEQNIAVWLRHKHTTIADKSEMNKKRYIKNMAFSKKSEKYFQFSIVYTKLNTVFGFCKMLTVFETNNCGHKKRASAYTIFAVRNSAVVGRWGIEVTKKQTKNDKLPQRLPTFCGS